MSDTIDSSTADEQGINRRSWGEAATLVIVSKDDPPLNDRSGPLTDLGRPLAVSCDYRILLLQRQPRSRSFAGASVFPGGVVEPADFSPRWFEVFGKLGIFTDDDFGWSHMKGKPRAGPIAAPRPHGLLPNDVAFRICAIRETFEESGVLIASRKADVIRSIALRKGKRFVPSSSYLDSANVTINKQEWRRRVHKDAYQFLEMFLELDIYPNLWSLFELSTILTPPGWNQRYDTIFYSCSLDTLPDAEVDHKEMIDLKWLTPAEGLRMHYRKDINLPMPQLSECARLLNFPKLTDLQNYLARQMDQGMSMEVPVIIKLKDGLIRVLPGDDCYPTILDGAKLRTLNETEEENLKRCQNLNRFTFKHDGHFTMVCNVTLPHGQYSPRDIDSNDLKNNSRL